MFIEKSETHNSNGNDSSPKRFGGLNLFTWVITLGRQWLQNGIILYPEQYFLKYLKSK